MSVSTTKEKKCHVIQIMKDKGYAARYTIYYCFILTLTFLNSISTFLTLLVAFRFLPLINTKNTSEMFQTKNLNLNLNQCKSNELILTRYRMSKCNKLNYSSNNGSVKNNFQTILKESY